MPSSKYLMMICFFIGKDYVSKEDLETTGN